MFPTSPLPVAPVLIPSGIGLVVVILALGVGVGLLIASVRHRHRHHATIAVDGADEAKPATNRLSA